MNRRTCVYLMLLSFLMCGHKTIAQTATKLEARLSAEELKLYELVTAYRKANDLPEIPLSVSLTYVAQEHCKDLYLNKPDLNKNCNTHSWSDKGRWSSCCYTPDHKQSACMWNKPREMTSYKADGFEIACGSSEAIYDHFVMTADYALNSWKGSVHHNNVVLNKDIWKTVKWNAIGIGVYKGFAVIWFGQETDAAGAPAK